MNIIDSNKLADIQGAGRSYVNVRQPVRLAPKAPANPLPLPKPGPVIS